jgi:hypothetical protein
MAMSPGCRGGSPYLSLQAASLLASAMPCLQVLEFKGNVFRIILKNIKNDRNRTNFESLRFFKESTVERA